MRVSQRWQIELAIHHLHRNQEATENLRTQIGTGRRIQEPHDDPQGTQQAINLRTSLSAIENALRNLGFTQDWMEATTSALDEMKGLLGKARLEAQRAANDTLSDDIRQTLAAEVNEFFSQAVNISNTQHRELYVFGGHRVDQQPFVSDPATLTVTYRGDNGSIKHEVEPGSETVVNVAGSDPLFDAAFNALKTLHDGLATGDMDAVRNSMDALDHGIDLVLQQEATLGARLRAVDGTRARLQKTEVDLRALLSSAEDTDVAEALLKLYSSEQGYQATLNAYSRIMPMSLFDYLR